MTVTPIARLVLRRALLAVPVLVLVSVAIFALAAASPFDPLSAYLGDRYLTMDPDDQARLAAQLGFDDPWPQRYLHWAGDLLTGDLGTSVALRQPVVDVIVERLPWTILLVAVALLMAMSTALVLGVWSAWRQGGWVDRAVTAFSHAIEGIPPFVVALGAIAVFGVALSWLPVAGLTDAGAPVTFAQVARHLVLPALVLGLSQTPVLLLHVRQSLLTALSDDHVAGARARGLPEARVVLRHALPAALLPFTTLLGARVAEIVTGAVLVEEVFSWPGAAQAVVRAAVAVDFPLLAALTLLSTIAVLVGSLLADVAYALLDPRVAADG
ncbi:ABC transporter permease [Polymorphospora sp. NPDC051019]|uniref:ABC transporter permease n=1 Tax=Polymorphospora sp. NPDC051019 TaxID=3155725 RepID=UPI003436747A